MTSGSCRFCRSPLHLSFANLGMSPPSNSYLEASDLNRMERFYPLHAWVCENCFLVQLEEFETPEQIFSEYAYFSSYSDSWLAHARSYVEGTCRRFSLGKQSFVVEVASNDGYLLQYFVAKGVPVLGIEPAANVAAEARRKGIPTLVKFFGTKTAEDLAASRQKADLIIGNNVLAHVPDLNDFVRGLALLLKQGGVITMEFPHLLRLIEENQFDTIYHEHFSYFSFLVVERVFAAHGLALFDVEEIPTHGGSLRIYARLATQNSETATGSVAELRARERAAGLERPETYSAFAERVKRTKRLLLKFLIEARDSGKTVVGYGAPAKGNTLLNYCGVRTDLLDFTVDRSPHKLGRFLPGVHIPVLAPDEVMKTKPDYLLILPWNIKDEIVSQMADIRRWGGRFVIPIPEVRIIE